MGFAERTKCIRCNETSLIVHKVIYLLVLTNARVRLHISGRVSLFYPFACREHGNNVAVQDASLSSTMSCASKVCSTSPLSSRIASLRKQ